MSIDELKLSLQNGHSASVVSASQFFSEENKQETLILFIENEDLLRVNLNF